MTSIDHDARGPSEGSWRSRVAVCALAFLVTAWAGVAGCGSGDPDAVPAVSAAGTVKYNGKPVESGTIQFVPEKGRPAHGKIEGGKFTLTTYKDNDGAIPGSHKVGVVSTKEARPKSKGGEPETVYVIPKRFAEAQGSGIVIEIPSGGKQDIEVNINGK